MSRGHGETQAFNVRPADLKTFLEKAGRGDSMGGNEITLIKDMGERILVVIQREYRYPYIISELRELEK